MATEKETFTGVTPAAASRDDIAALFARRQQAYDNLNAEALAGDYADDAVIESPVSGTHGKAGAVEGLRAVFAAFVDLKLTTERLIIDGSQVAQIVRIEGTNMGGLFGLPPSGKRFHAAGAFVYELRGTQIVREQRIYDFAGMLIQVGVLRAKPA